MQKYLAAIFERTYGHSPNTQAQGGAVYAENVDINDCFFLDCVALDAGGAIYNVGGTITDCLFEVVMLVKVVQSIRQAYYAITK